jgi:hypothetical protein
MAFTEDFDAFLDEDDGFGTSCVYNGVEIIGILDKEYIETSLTQGYAPILLVKERDDFAHGDSITVGEDVYTIREYHQDGTGMTKLVLEAT